MNDIMLVVKRKRKKTESLKMFIRIPHLMNHQTTDPKSYEALNTSKTNVDGPQKTYNL